MYEGMHTRMHCKVSLQGAESRTMHSWRNVRTTLEIRCQLPLAQRWAYWLAQRNASGHF